MNTVPEDVAESVATTLANALEAKEPLSLKQPYTYTTENKCYVVRTFYVDAKRIGKDMVVSFKMEEKYPRKVVKRIEMDYVDEVRYVDGVLTIGSEGFAVSFETSADE